MTEYAQSDMNVKAFRQAPAKPTIGATTIISARDANGTRRGFTANSSTPVSLDPPVLLASNRMAATSIATSIRSTTSHGNASAMTNQYPAEVSHQWKIANQFTIYMGDKIKGTLPPSKKSAHPTPGENIGFYYSKTDYLR